MVRNDAGGNKGKGLARKHVNASKGGASKQLRVATDEAEKYAVVSKMLGNGMCYVSLLDGSVGTKLCIIRNKFKGRGKRDNILDSGSWVLVGLREWASKQDTCDLLEVYNDGERDRLMKNEPCFKAVALTSESNNAGNSSIQFTDSETMKYGKLVKGDGDDDGDGDGDDDGDGDGDDDDDELMQQRVYDMPPSDSDSDEPDEPVKSVLVKAAPVKSVPKAAPVDYINVDDI